MGKARIPIIIASCVLLMISLAGYLIFHKDSPDKDNPTHTDRGIAAASTVSSGAITYPSNNSSSNYTYIPPTYEYNNNKNNKEDQMSNNESTWTPATEIDLDPTSITVFVNQEYCLPKNYVPENLVIPDIAFDTADRSERTHMRIEAAEAIEKLFAAALEDGYALYGISGYRSYNRQKQIFLNNIIHKGKKHTLKYSAAPGTSEHQTGLAMDVSSKSVRYKLVTSFANCDEGKWLSNNAHKFGFIIRYPEDQYETTGYAYEPWHIRYVGKDLANYLYQNNLTMEDYYKYEPSEGFDYQKKYAALINYRPPVTPTPIPEEELEEALDDLTDEDLENDDINEEDLEDDELDDELDNDIDDHKDKDDKDKESKDKDNEDKEDKDKESKDKDIEDREDKDKENKNKDIEDREDKDKENKNKDIEDREDKDKVDKNKDIEDKDNMENLDKESTPLPNKAPSITPTSTPIPTKAPID